MILLRGGRFLTCLFSPAGWKPAPRRGVPASARPSVADLDAETGAVGGEGSERDGTLLLRLVHRVDRQVRDPPAQRHLREVVAVVVDARPAGQERAQKQR